MISQTSKREKPLALVVDDDLSLRLSMCGALTKAGFDTIEAENGCEAIIAMGHSLGMKIVAEGIENEEQLDLLKEYGADEGQGYYFSPPVSQEEFTRFLVRDGI